MPLFIKEKHSNNNTQYYNNQVRECNKYNLRCLKDA